MNSIRKNLPGEFFYGKKVSINIVLVFSLFFLLAAFPSFTLGNRDSSTAANEVVIWTYNSFNSEWGPGPDVARVFEEETGIRVVWENHRDAGSIVSRLLMEGENANADLILGLDQNLAVRVLDSNLLSSYRPRGAENIFPELILDPQWRLIPLDYSFFAINYDSERITNPPASLEDLTHPRYANSLILLDPRTSSPGLGFFAWVQYIYGNNWLDYWRRLLPSILTVSESWSTGYGLYTRGEAPLVLSYTTSPAYHLEYEDTDRFRAVVFEQGNPLQIEAAAILRNARNPENARLFLDFMLSPSFQSIIPLTNWMYPVIDIPLPASFTANPKSDRPLMPGHVTEEDLNEWAALMLRGY